MKQLIAVLLLGIWCTSAIASVGEVAEIDGSGVVKRDSDTLEGQLGLGIEMQDIVATAKGSMQLNFVDDTRVDVTAHSRLLIDEFVYDPGTQTGALSLKAGLGAVRYASGQIAKNSRQRVSIRTPSATIGVRGTDFMMVVDEIGGSMITLLPSCNTAGECVVGEISVESDIGFVIMNQAFQTTVVPHRGIMPSKPVTLELPENMLTSMIIFRKKTAYDEQAEKTIPITDILDIDFLAFDELDRDPLVEGIKSLWITDLDNVNYFTQLLYDELDRQMQEMIAAFMDELDAQNELLLGQVMLGLDPETNIFFDLDDPDYIVKRREGDEHYLELRLSQSYGYQIDMIQEGFSIYRYRVGAGNNSIYINQTN